MMEKPKVIFLDAVGTLFGVQPSVGDIYARLARDYGVDLSPSVINQAFYKSFKMADPLAFPGASWREIKRREYEWWRAIVAQTFQMAEGLERFSDFSTFFAELYAHFASGEPWVVYDDVPRSLQRWQDMGIELGVISNFDSRLHNVLQELKLGDFFQSVTISSEVGAAKPEATIFQKALEKHNCDPAAAWHVGDSWSEDIEGAKAVGMRAVRIQRD
jgi:putative hydrolase of the HAD superfamily